MLDTSTQNNQRWLNVDKDTYARLNWLIAANRYEENRRRLFRNDDDEWQMQLMRRPIRTERAYALLGLLLGTLVPAAIFYRFLIDNGTKLILLCLLMNVITMLVGRKVGAHIGKSMDEVERSSRIKMMLLAAFYGACWAIATGAAGGAVVFGFGALFGALIAFPVGILAFILFTPLHRLASHGGMIAARHFWPLACGVVLFIVALILGR
jgi:hypothetical protein